jgi:hypothetical protein
MDKYDRFKKELLEWGARTTGPTGHSPIRIIEVAIRHEIPEFDVEQLIEQMYHAHHIDLSAWDGASVRPFKGWSDARMFWDSPEDGGYKRVRTLIDGKKWLVELEKQVGPEAASTRGRSETTVITIFVSHSGADREIAEALAELLRAAFALPPEEIRCTSTVAYSLPYGADTPELLRTELKSAPVVIGIITRTSVESAWVLFELGARWGHSKYLVPLLARGADASLLPPPIKDANALNCSSEMIIKLVEEVAEQLGHPLPRTTAYGRQLRELVRLSGKIDVSALTTPQKEYVELVGRDSRNLVVYRKRPEEGDGFASSKNGRPGAPVVATTCAFGGKSGRIRSQIAYLDSGRAKFAGSTAPGWTPGAATFR